MKRILVLLVIALPVTVLIAVPGKTKEPNDVSDFMRLKLEYAQGILEGLTTEDFEMIAKNSQDMSLISLDSTWNVVHTDEYAKQSAEFRRTSNALTRAADSKNLDGAALAYVGLTMRCINCHKYVRAIDE